MGTEQLNTCDEEVRYKKRTQYRGMWARYQSQIAEINVRQLLHRNSAPSVYLQVVVNPVSI